MKIGMSNVVRGESFGKLGTGLGRRTADLSASNHERLFDKLTTNGTSLFSMECVVCC